MSGGQLLGVTGRTVPLMQPLPAGISNGSMVYVAREVAKLVATAPPSRVSQPRPTTLLAGGVLPPSTTFNPGASVEVACVPAGVTVVIPISGPTPINNEGNPPQPVPPPTTALVWVASCVDSSHDGQNLDTCPAGASPQGAGPPDPGPDSLGEVYATNKAYCALNDFETGRLRTNVDGYFILTYGFTCYQVDTSTWQIVAY